MKLLNLLLYFILFLVISGCGQMGTLYHPMEKTVDENITCSGKWSKDPIPFSIEAYGTVYEDMFGLVACKKLTPRGGVGKKLIITYPDKRVIHVKVKSEKLVFDDVTIFFPNGSRYNGQVTDNFIPHGQGSWSHEYYVPIRGLRKLKSAGIEYISLVTSNEYTKYSANNSGHPCPGFMVVGNFINGEIDGNSIFSYGGAEPPKVSDFFEGDQEKRWGNNECLANDDRINKLIIRPLDPNKGFTIKGEIINNVLLGSVEDRQWNIGVTSGMPCKGTIKNVFPKVKGKYINESYNFCYKWEYSNTNPSLMKIK